jgi:hypothetical protein
VQLAALWTCTWWEGILFHLLVALARKVWQTAWMGSAAQFGGDAHSHGFGTWPVQPLVGEAPPQL